MGIRNTILFFVFILISNCHFDNTFEEIYRSNVLNSHYVSKVKGDKLILISSQDIALYLLEKADIEKQDFFDRLKKHKLTEYESSKLHTASEVFNGKFPKYLTADKLFLGKESNFLNYSYFLQNNGYVLLYDDYEGFYTFQEKQVVFKEILRRKQEKARLEKKYLKEIRLLDSI